MFELFEKYKGLRRELVLLTLPVQRRSLQWDWRENLERKKTEKKLSYSSHSYSPFHLPSAKPWWIQSPSFNNFNFYQKVVFSFQSKKYVLLSHLN